MDQPAGMENLREQIAAMLQRPRELKQQTSRHLEEHLDPEGSDVQDFFQRAASELEDYEVEILFAPIFTPSFEEQVEVVEPLASCRPSAQEVAALAGRLIESLKTCSIVLPEGDLASLTLHPVLIDRYVRMLRLENAPVREVVDSIRESLAEDLAPVALALLRQKGFTSNHQEWCARFLEFAAGRHAVDRETLEILAEFLASQISLEGDALLTGMDHLLRAAIETGAFFQKGRMYWSMDVAEHHNYRGAGHVDGEQVEKKMKEVRILEILKADLESFSDLGL